MSLKCKALFPMARHKSHKTNPWCGRDLFSPTQYPKVILFSTMNDSLCYRHHLSIYHSNFQKIKMSDSEKIWGKPYSPWGQRHHTVSILRGLLDSGGSSPMQVGQIWEHFTDIRLPLQLLILHKFKPQSLFCFSSHQLVTTPISAVPSGRAASDLPRQASLERKKIRKKMLFSWNFFPPDTLQGFWLIAKHHIGEIQVFWTQLLQNFVPFSKSWTSYRKL